MENNASSFFGDPSLNKGVLTPIFCGELYEDLSTDSIIPDTVSDIDKALLCTATPKIDGYYVNGNTLEIEGSVTYSSLLLTDNGELMSLSFSDTFEMRQELGFDSSACQIILSIKPETPEIKLVNPRKMNLRSRVCVAARVMSYTSTEPMISGTESLEDDMNLQRDHIDVIGLDAVTAEEKHVSASLDVELDSNDPPAFEILSCQVILTPSDVKIRDNEADVRMEACASLIYRTEEGNCFTAERRFSLEKTVALPCSGPWEWTCTASPYDITAQIAANGYGEMKVVELDFCYDLQLTALRNVKISAVSDMYSVEYETETEFRELPVIRLQRVYATGLSVNASASREELGAGDAREIFTGNATLRDCTVSYRNEKNKLVTEGMADIVLVCENHGAEEGTAPYTSYAFSQPFRCEMDAAEGTSEGDYLPDCRVSAVKFRIDSSNLYADLELSIRVMAFASETVCCLKKLRLDHDRPIDRRHAPITLCY
ncbi:MAG: hypothetical protein IJD10_00230, partial [Clostridia bacterium]|nr:hypothetical protein [Clostridia bacterium]